MKTAERPAAIDAPDRLGVEVQGEELETVLALLEQSRKHDPKTAERLKRAKDLALHAVRTGHLPAQTA
jgi:hypothetical protein